MNDMVGFTLGGFLLEMKVIKNMLCAYLKVLVMIDARSCSCTLAIILLIYGPESIYKVHAEGVLSARHVTSIILVGYYNVGISDVAIM